MKWIILIIVIAIILLLVIYFLSRLMKSWKDVSSSGGSFWDKVKDACCLRGK